MTALPKKSNPKPSAPLFAPLSKRSAGVFCHISSLPGPWGLGTVGQEAREFVDFLKGGGFSLWQVCPLGPTGFGDSPYQSFSSRAGNLYFLDWDVFIQAGWLLPKEAKQLRTPHPDQVDFGGWYQTFWPIWEQVAARFLESPGDLEAEFQKFCEAEENWLLPYATFSALKVRFEGSPWYSWPKVFRSWKSLPKEKLSDQDHALCAAHQVGQFFFFRQWDALKTYANQSGIRLIGDIPIYVSGDSADLWSEPEHFHLNADGSPKAVAGVPPDYFTPEGQLWGNPLYQWKAMEKNGFRWWNERLSHNFRWFDTVRLDHFRGFAAYWSVPANAKTAKEGKWVPGPGLALLQEWANQFPDDRLIAEDLGLITEEVNALLTQSGLPRMAVLQFAFNGDPDNLYLPHNLERNMVVYTGTHDNNTSAGWYAEAPDIEKDRFRTYMRVSGDNAPWDLIRSVYESVARWCVIPLQDLLSLGSEARFNTPGVPDGNWSWRATKNQLEGCQKESSSYLASLAILYGRHPDPDTHD